MPFSASAQIPESSATAGSPVNAAIARALSSAFSSNVAPVSATSGAPGKSARLVSETPAPGPPEPSRIRDSSVSLCGLNVASTRRAVTAPSLLGQRRGLPPGQLGAAGRRQPEHLVQLGAAERL